MPDRLLLFSQSRKYQGGRATLHSCQKEKFVQASTSHSRSSGFSCASSRMTYSVASKPIPEDRSIIANRVGAAFASVRTMPVIADRNAPPPTVNAADSPDALPASSGRTETTPALLLGIANPLPRPTQAQAPKYIGKFTAS